MAAAASAAARRAFASLSPYLTHVVRDGFQGRAADLDDRTGCLRQWCVFHFKTFGLVIVFATFEELSS